MSCACYVIGSVFTPALSEDGKFGAMMNVSLTNEVCMGLTQKPTS